MKLAIQRRDNMSGIKGNFAKEQLKQTLKMV